MKKIEFVFAMILVCASVKAQEKDPKIQSVTTRFERIEIIRMKPGTDMLEGLNKTIKEKKIKNIDKGRSKVGKGDGCTDTVDQTSHSRPS